MVQNIVSGIIGMAIWAVGAFMLKCAWLNSCRKFFGELKGNLEERYIAYGRFELDIARLPGPQAWLNQQSYEDFCRFPYTKPAGQATFSILKPISEGEVRGIAHLTSRLSLPLRQEVALSPADTLINRSAIHVISLGGPHSNEMTERILRSNANNLAEIRQYDIYSKSTNAVMYTRRDGFDCGLILRVTEDSGQVWIACAGIGEWGTSGASYFLANKWQLLSSKARHPANIGGFWGTPDFAAVVEVEFGNDESASLVSLKAAERSYER